MALLWFNLGLSDENRAKLIELYYELGGEAFIWPQDDEKRTIIPLHIESVEEIDRIMRQPTKWRGKPGRNTRTQVVSLPLLALIAHSLNAFTNTPAERQPGLRKREMMR